METIYILLLSVLVAVLLFLFIWLKPDLAKKYWAYILGGLSAVVALVILLAQKKQPPLSPDPEMKEKEDQLEEDLSEVHKRAEAEIAGAKESEEIVLTEVEDITKVADEEERLKRLSDLFNRTRNPR